jgi:ferric-chelate reductase [NAD(P)H]
MTMNKGALYKLGYGVYIVGSHRDGKYNGQIANTVFQITSDPPTLGVSINRNNLTHELIESTGVLSVSVLCEDTPMVYIGGFGFKSGRDIDKTEGKKWKVGVTGAPVFLDYVTAYMEVKVSQHLDVGTHTLYIGEVVAAEVLTEDNCMTYAYYHQVKRGKTPKAAPSYIEEK